MLRETRLANAFAELTDVDIHDFDVASYACLLARHSVRLLDVDAAGLLLTSKDGKLTEQGATTDVIRHLQRLQIRLEAGPSIESFRTHQPVSAPDLRSGLQWTRYHAAVLDAGFATVISLPLRAREEVIGSMTLFRRRAGGLAEDELTVAKALVHVATTCLLLKRALETSETLNRQLQDAFCVRVTIEQAKGILAERRGSTLAGAFEVMRAFARHDHRKLTEVAHAIIDDSPSVSNLAIRRPRLRKPRSPG